MNMEQLKVLIVFIGIAGVIFGLMRPFMLNLKTRAIQSQREEKRKISKRRY